MRGPGGPAGLQNRFAAVMRPWRFDSPAFREWRYQVTGLGHQDVCASEAHMRDRCNGANEAVVVGGSTVLKR